VNPVLLIHWNEAKAEDRVRRLRKAGFAPLILLSSVPNAPADLFGRLVLSGH
jgi:hypothetical protein